MSRFHAAFKGTGIPRSLPSVAILTDLREAYEKIVTLEESNIIDSFTGEYGISGSIIKGEPQEYAVIFYPSIPSLTLNLMSDATTAGVKVLIKLGVGLSVTSNLNTGSVVIVRSAVRNDFITNYIIDPKLPAIPDFDLYFKVKRSMVGRLLQTPDDEKKNKLTGCIVLSLGYIGKHINIKEGELSSLIKNPRICAVDMDSSVIYSYSYIRNIKPVSILVIKESLSAFSTFDLADTEEEEEAKKNVSEIILNIYRILKESLDYVLGSGINE